MDRQVVLNKVIRHLLSQNKQATGIHGCVYRSSDGLKCAIGCLIPDEIYSSDLECRTADHCDIIAALELSMECALNGNDISFLRQLQKIHDGHNPEAWANVLQHFAQTNGLRYNAPT